MTTFTSSDFGRTCTPNGGAEAAGADHAWGGHQFIMGGCVKGGDIYGQMPELVVDGPDDVNGDHGRWIPTTSVDEYLPALESVKLQPIARELEALHAVDSHPEDDIDLPDAVFRQYRRTFGKNPVGLNEAIVAALAGRNDKAAALISPEHPAIDDQGRLLDRWGTPHFFHQLSDDELEIISAGPDKTLFTDDDVTMG